MDAEKGLGGESKVGSLLELNQTPSFWSSSYIAEGGKLQPAKSPTFVSYVSLTKPQPECSRIPEAAGGEQRQKERDVEEMELEVERTPSPPPLKQAGHRPFANKQETLINKLIFFLLSVINNYSSTTPCN